MEVCEWRVGFSDSCRSSNLVAVIQGLFQIAEPLQPLAPITIPYLGPSAFSCGVTECDVSHPGLRTSRLSSKQRACRRMRQDHIRLPLQGIVVMSGESLSRLRWCQECTS